MDKGKKDLLSKIAIYTGSSFGKALSSQLLNAHKAYGYHQRKRESATIRHLIINILLLIAILVLFYLRITGRYNGWLF